MALELDFFQAAVQDGRQPKVGLLVLDFDETLSVSDTTTVIINSAIQSAGSQRNGEPLTEYCQWTVESPSALFALRNSAMHCFTCRELDQPVPLNKFSSS